MYTVDGLWNHNLHHSPVLLRSLPAPCASVLDIGAGLQRMADLTAPGVVAVVGLARSSRPIDHAWDAVGAVKTRLHRLRRPHTMVTAPICDPAETYAEVQSVATQVLPGVRFRRHPLFRYSLVWTKPIT